MEISGDNQIKALYENAVQKMQQKASDDTKPY